MKEQLDFFDVVGAQEERAPRSDPPNVPPPEPRRPRQQQGVVRLPDGSIELHVDLGRIARKLRREALREVRSKRRMT